MQLFLFFVIWRIADFFIAFATQSLNLANSRFSFGFQPRLEDHLIPQLIVAFANFDGVHYLHIAHDGYQQYEETFFPLYPFIIHLLAPLFGNSYLLTGIFITNLCFLGGLYFFKKYLEILGKKPQTILWIMLFLIFFPMSFFFGAVYTEGLFFLLVTSTLYFAQKKRYIPLIIVGILAAITRLMGIFLFIPVLAILLGEKEKFSLKQKNWKAKIRALFNYINKNKKLVFLSLTPLLGLFVYMGYLHSTTGDYLAFYHSQNAFNNGRTADHLILLPQVYYRYLKILFTASHDVTYFVAVVEFTIFTLFLIVLLYDLWKVWKQKYSPEKINLLGLNLFSLINLILPTFTGTLTSTPRYVLLSLSFFLRIAEIKNIFVKIVLLCLFGILHIILLSLFIQGYFVG